MQRTWTSVVIATALAACGGGNNNAICGDGFVSALEECDGDDLGGRTCESEGFAGGTLSCSQTCFVDTSGCTQPGGAITVTVLVDDVPTAGIPVGIYVDLAQPTRTDGGPTDAQGQFTTTADLPAEGNAVVVAITCANGSHQVRQFEGVAAGSEVVVDFSCGTTPTQLGNLSVTAATVPAGATTKVFDNGCISNTSSTQATAPVNLVQLDSCADENNEASVLGTWFDGTGGLVAWQRVTDIPVLSGSPTPVALDTPSTTLRTHTCSLVNATGGDFGFNFDATYDRIRFRPFETLVSTTPGGTHEVTKSFPDLTPDDVTCSVFDEQRACLITKTTPALGTTALDGEQTAVALAFLIVGGSPDRPIAELGEALGGGAPATFTSVTVRYNGLTLSLFAPGDATTLAPAYIGDPAFADYELAGRTRLVGSTSASRTVAEGMSYSDVLLGTPITSRSSCFCFDSP